MIKNVDQREIVFKGNYLKMKKQNNWLTCRFNIKIEIHSLVKALKFL